MPEVEADCLQGYSGAQSLFRPKLGALSFLSLPCPLKPGQAFGSLCTEDRDCLLQVNMQALVLVSVFRQQTRDKLVEYIEWCLPDRIPWLWDRMGYRHTPAQMVHNAIVSKIGAFQASVARRQSASHQDPRRALRLCDGSCRRLQASGIRAAQPVLSGRADVLLETAGWGLGPNSTRPDPRDAHAQVASGADG